MAEEKRYFWIKIRQDFFTDPYIKILRRMAGGDTYTIIYLKMLVKSADTNGTIYFQGAGDDLAEELSLMLDEGVENVRALLAYLEAKKLITHPDFTDDIFLIATPDLTGSETGSAQRVRKFRARQNQEITLQSNSGVTISNDSKSKSKSKSKNIEIEPETENNPAAGYSKIVKMLEENGFGLIGGIVAQNVSDELKDFAEKSDLDNATAILEKAIQISVLNGVANFKYVLAITKKWYDQKLFTISDVEASENKHSQNKQVKPLDQDMSKMTREEQLIAVMGKDGVRF